MAVSVRLLADRDWSAIDSIQHQAYPPSLLESLDVLRQKQQVSPKTCWVLVNTHDQVLGYLIAHRWSNSQQPPPLDTCLPQGCVLGELLYIHDLALSTDARGKGMTQPLWQAFEAHATLEKSNRWMLVAVNGSASFWQRKGFRMSQKVSSEKGYGDDAQLMLASPNLRSNVS